MVLALEKTSTSRSPTHLNSYGDSSDDASKLTRYHRLRIWCLESQRRITNAKTALAHWIGAVETKVGKI
jgi:hypothetical protein